jgi:tetratricopeptide (TPR) repeat protein
VKGTHPDLHPGDPEAGLKFRQIVRASEILADQDQRAAYDHLLDLADQEQRQIKRHAVAHTIYQVTSGVIAFSLALGVIAGSYLAVMQLPDEWVPSLGRVATTMRQSTEAAASTLRQSRDAAVSALRQSTEAVSAVIIPSPPSPAMASTDPKIVETKVVETKIAEAKVKTAPPGKNDTIELPPEVTLPTVVTLQPEIGASPPAKVGPPLDITLVDARAYRDHGIVAYRNGDLDGAIADFDQAIQLDPKFSAAYIDRGIVFYRLRKFDRAFADISRARRLERANRGTPGSGANSPATNSVVAKKPRAQAGIALGMMPMLQRRPVGLD